MPIYEYETESGDVVTRLVPVDQRDSQSGLRRKTVPSTLRVLCGEPTPDQLQARNVLKGYHNLECKEGSRFRSSFTKQQIKEAWSNN